MEIVVRVAYIFGGGGEEGNEREILNVNFAKIVRLLVMTPSGYARSSRSETYRTYR